MDLLYDILYIYNLKNVKIDENYVIIINTYFRLYNIINDLIPCKKLIYIDNNCNIKLYYKSNNAIYFEYNDLYKKFIIIRNKKLHYSTDLIIHDKSKLYKAVLQNYITCAITKGNYMRLYKNNKLFWTKDKTSLKTKFYIETNKLSKLNIIKYNIYNIINLNYLNNNIYIYKEKNDLLINQLMKYIYNLKILI